MTTEQVRAIATDWVQVASEGIELPAYMAWPLGDLPATGLGRRVPVVVVLQEIFGVNGHIRAVTERLAAAGYVAIAPALFHRIAPGFESGYDPAAIATGREYKFRTRVRELLADINATIQVALNHPVARVGPVGCLGFCFGGHVAYLAATLPQVAATASFYGAGIVSWLPGTEPGSGPATLDYTPAIRGTLWAFFGDQDASIPPTEVAQIEAALRAGGKDYRMVRYAEAEHGFFCDARASYHAPSAADAWEKVLELLGQLG